MLLVCGDLRDESVALVLTRARELEIAHRFIDLTVFPVQHHISWQWEGGYPTGTISTADWILDVADITGAYIRYAFVNPGGIPPLEDFAATARMESQWALSVLLQQLPIAVTTRIANGMSNNSKPYQSFAIRSVGLSIPESLITSDPRAARAFRDRFHGEIIVKSLCGALRAVHRATDADLDQLQSEQPVPLFLQRFIPGDNIRVHTVGSQLFATRCASDVVDYRYARSLGSRVDFDEITLPAWIESACRRLASAMALVLTGIDLKRTPDGEYFGFEINPAPVFAWYERHTGQPISLTLTKLLSAGSKLSQGGPPWR
jgi:hypothetical protein